jgi:16S rRNA (guanine966-N2)-methyltransferase
VRVIAGRLGGRELRAPRGGRTRPTSDRVKEALFSMLGDLEQASVLDLYAGSGALGIEALSRGARHATFVEPARAALAALRANLARLGLQEHARVIALPVERAGGKLAGDAPYDLVLCDPPWAELPLAIESVGRLLESALLSSSARLIVEHPAREALELGELAGLERRAARRWGDTAVTIFSAR